MYNTSTVAVVIGVDIIVGAWFVGGAPKQPTNKGKNNNKDVMTNIFLLIFFFIKNIPPELKIFIFSEKLNIFLLYNHLTINFISNSKHILMESVYCYIFWAVKYYENVCGVFSFKLIKKLPTFI